MAGSSKNLPPVSISFGAREWAEEVERYEPKAVARLKADSARRAIEAGKQKLIWRSCEAISDDGTRLPGCRKLYIPLGEEGSSAAPYGFIFQLAKFGDELIWSFIAFGERHPNNPRSRNVYERAHKRLNGRYP